ncbi:MAG: metallophosphoesterase, partial [Bacteroidota bacterium]
MRLIKHIKFKNALALLGGILLINVNVMGQTFTEILARPTNTTITMSILFDQKADVYWEYGTTSGTYTNTTPTYVAVPDSAFIIDFINLQPNTKYYYRTRSRVNGTTTAYQTGTERSFHTARPAGNTFSFAIEADPHMDTNSNPTAYTLTLQNILAQSPDFLIDLGDIFMSEKLPVINPTEIRSRHLLYRPYFGATCHSVPLFLVIGNHEGELGWMNNGTDTCLPVRASNIRRQYYPNPLPNTFYSGDSVEEPHVGLRGNYYSYEWGNCLIVVLDPYWYTLTKPGWGWTLGATQYNWFKNVLNNSHAKFKFVFCHQLVGGNGSDGRGGIEFADFWEMGGENADSTFGFNTNRPGWDSPIHQLMLDNQVNVF